MNDPQYVKTELELIMAAAKLTRTNLDIGEVASILAYSMNLTLPEEAPQLTRYDVCSVLSARYELKYYIWYSLDAGLSQYHLINKMGFSNSQVTREVNGEVKTSMWAKKPMDVQPMIEPWEKIRSGFLDFNAITKKDIINVRRAFL